jgi:N-acyl-D-amino-acid deacylase
MRIPPVLTALAALLVAGSTTLAQTPDYDLVIRNGRVVDGTGNPAFFADVAVKDGHIASVGKLAGKGRRELDARGLVIAPGFIDVHSHAEDIDDLPLAENFVRMGVTTVVLGNCGGSKTDVGEFFSLMEDKTFSPNICTLIGQGTVRNRVMGGSFLRPPTEEELGKMKTMVDKAMKDGAVGLSTGLIYLPGTFTKTEEIIELARVASAYDGIYVSHMRSETTSIYDALDELFRIAREANIRAEVSHIKLSGKSAWGQADKVLAAIEKARASGLDVTHDQYMYPASSTSLSTLIPDSAREGGRDKFMARISNPAEKAKIVQQMKDTLKRSGRDDYSYAVIASYRTDKSFNGMNVVQAAKKKRGADSLDDQIELVLEVEKSGGASAVFHGMSEEDLRKFLQHPNTMIASDSGVRRFQEGVPHPRGYGNNARALAKYVRELGLLRLEEAVRRMTTLPATTFRLKDRGQIREGAWADIAIFDPAKVQDRATFEDPHHYATGFKYVLVNGVPVVENDQHTQARPGKALRHRPTNQPKSTH